tara:strand:- start:468 stop:776 length:309 start_codon:yes stop_codon:yes gene_type:complete
VPTSPCKIEIVGNFLAIQWSDGKECFIDAQKLRNNSPSAENKGESDIFGNLSLTQKNARSGSPELMGFEKVGNYAIRIRFSDGHSTGIYSWDLLRSLGDSIE